jgi:hypothetical protein
MLSAPAAIPAMIEVNFPTGFTPADATLLDASDTRPAISSDRLVCSASAIAGTRPAQDTTFGSSKTDAPPDHPCCSFTLSAFWIQINQDFSTPDSSVPEGTFHV